MRFVDVLHLALSALWQQKVRTVLTTLGVIFGTFVLVASMSINRGVQETIVREHSKFGEMRRIYVHPTQEAAKPAVKIEVKGDMSEERRARLRQELAWRQNVQGPVVVRLPLTPDRLKGFAQLDHVARVLPMIDLPARVEFNGNQQDTVVVGMPPDHKDLEQRIVAGEFPTGGEGHGVLISEYLLYRLGVQDEKGMAAAPGQKLRLMKGRDPQKSHLLLNLLNPGQAQVGPGETDLLGKVLRQLPKAIDQMELADHEKLLLQVLLKLDPAKMPKQAQEPPQPDEFTILGVFRRADKDAPRNWRSYGRDDIDVYVPVIIAEGLFFRAPDNLTQGVHQAMVEVDTWENVKEVNQQIRAQGFNTSSLVEFLEREQLMYLLIFGAMTCVAAVALLVAGLSITNTMLISILERMREVGIMKAVGARDRQIQLIFLIEGSLIGLAGGLVGLLLGWVASLPGDAWVRSMVERQMHVRLSESIFVFPWWILVGAPLFAALVTTLAAVYPAWRAARVNPITALRHE